ncbi:MAG TPA: segregation/condensation protein A [Anaerolineae bacterium]|jgi:segregation and condensation protein A|nr:segregation/condensation protein A [Anaerolineae bacterium]
MPVSQRSSAIEQSAFYKIDLPVFSGPLDLLLHLIERNELDITAVSLVAVTDQYLEQVKELAGERLEQLMDFLSVGARLLLIKSRALLPSVPESAGIDEEEDPAEALAQQLRLYRRFKTAARFLAQQEHDGLRTYLRVAPPPVLERNLDLAGIDLDSLIAALRTALDRADMKEDSVSVVVQKRSVTIEDQIGLLRLRIGEHGQVAFNDLLSRRATWAEVSVTLLAVLELIKRHEVNARQPDLFGPIEIVAETTPVARSQV